MKDSIQFNRHDLIWTEDKILRFWNFIAQSEPHQQDYFAKQVGKGIVSFLRTVDSLEGRILDYGCGPGYLAGHLMTAGIRCEGCDFSDDSVKKVNDKFNGNPLWGGAKTISGEKFPYKDNSFDFIICLETIEHVLDKQLDTMLKEFHRILKPETGTLFITTPNKEDLGLFTVFCPDCGAVFHRYQHVRSFTAEALTDLMHFYGFQTKLCNVTLFNSFQDPHIHDQSTKHPFDWSLRYILSLLKRKLYLFLKKMIGSDISRDNEIVEKLSGQGPHLFWIGNK